MRSLAALVLALAMTGPAAAADLSLGGSYVEVPEVLLEDEDVLPTHTRVAYKQHCGSCGAYGLPWGGLGPNRHVDLPWGGLKSTCAPVKAVRISRPIVVRAKG